jgi:H+/Cl- antiporter ClcA
LPVQIVWFGATGGVLAGLGGVFYNNANWDHKYDYWHYSRPLVGGVVGGIGCLLFYVSIVVGNTQSVTPNVVTFDAVAFILGFADRAFRELIDKITQLLFGPGGTKEDPASDGSQAS